MFRIVLVHPEIPPNTGNVTPFSAGTALALPEGWVGEWEKFVRPNFSTMTTPLRPEYVVDSLQKVLPDDAILTCDSGVHHNWFMQFWHPKRAQSMLNSWGYSSMGFGVCSVLGAQLAAPDRPCISV